MVAAEETLPSANSLTSLCRSRRSTPPPPGRPAGPRCGGWTSPGRPAASVWRRSAPPPAFPVNKQEIKGLLTRRRRTRSPSAGPAVCFHRPPSQHLNLLRPRSPIRHGNYLHSAPYYLISQTLNVRWHVVLSHASPATYEPAVLLFVPAYLEGKLLRTHADIGRMIYLFISSVFFLLCVFFIIIIIIIILSLWHPVTHACTHTHTHTGKLLGFQSYWLCWLWGDGCGCSGCHRDT